MKKKMCLMLAVISISATFLMGCDAGALGLEEIIKDSTKEITTEEKESEYKSDMEALGNLEEAIKDALENDDTSSLLELIGGDISQDDMNAIEELLKDLMGEDAMMDLITQ